MTRRMQSTSDGPRNDDLASGSSEGCKTFVVEGPNLHPSEASRIRIPPERGAKRRHPSKEAGLRPQRSLSTRPLRRDLDDPPRVRVDKPSTSRGSYDRGGRK